MKIILKLLLKVEEFKILMMELLVKWICGYRVVVHERSYKHCCLLRR